MVLGFIGMTLFVVGLVMIIASIILKSNKGLSFMGGLLAIIGILLSMLVIVPAGHTGVKVRLGNVSAENLGSGPHFKMPVVEKVVNMTIQTQREDVEGAAASKDLQDVGYNVSINFNIVDSKAPMLYRDVGKDAVTVIIRPAVQECVKSNIAKYTAEELITNRAKVSSGIKDDISNRLITYGINTSEINIINMTFSAEFNAAIEAKSTASQKALQAKEDLERIKIEAEQKVVQAQAEADANTLKSQSMTDEIMMNKFIEKWDGKLPQIVGDNGGMIFDMPALMQAAQPAQ